MKGRAFLEAVAWAVAAVTVIQLLRTSAAHNLMEQVDGNNSSVYYATR